MKMTELLCTLKPQQIMLLIREQTKEPVHGIEPTDGLGEYRYRTMFNGVRHMVYGGMGRAYSEGLVYWREIRREEIK